MPEKLLLCIVPSVPFVALSAPSVPLYASLALFLLFCLMLSSKPLSHHSEQRQSKSQAGCIYIYYIHPEFRTGECRFGSGKGAMPLQRL